MGDTESRGTNEVPAMTLVPSLCYRIAQASYPADGATSRS